MPKTAAISRTHQPDPRIVAVLRFVLVSGCASALIMARYPLPF